MLAGIEALAGYFKVIAWVGQVENHLDRWIIEHLLKARVSAGWPAPGERFQVFLVPVISANKFQRRIIAKRFPVELGNIPTSYYSYIQTPESPALSTDGRAATLCLCGNGRFCDHSGRCACSVRCVKPFNLANRGCNINHVR